MKQNRKLGSLEERIEDLCADLKRYLEKFNKAQNFQWAEPLFSSAHDSAARQLPIHFRGD